MILLSSNYEGYVFKGVRKNAPGKKAPQKKAPFILYAWHLVGAICLENWITDPLIQVMLEIDTKTNELWWSNWSSH